METKQLCEVDIGYGPPKSETDLKKRSLDYMDIYKPHTAKPHVECILSGSLFLGGIWSVMEQAISPSRKETFTCGLLEDLSYYPPREKPLKEKLQVLQPDIIWSKLFRISTKLSYPIVIASVIWGIIVSMSNPLAIMFFILAGFFGLWFLIALDEWGKK